MATKRKQVRLMAVKRGMALQYVAGAHGAARKSWLKEGAALTCRATKFYDFHGRPLLRVEAQRGGKPVTFFVAPSNVKAVPR